MINKYRANCSSCNASFTVEYGRKTKTESIEVYGCSKCQNLFSLSNLQEFKCPMCGNDELIRYNFHKEENIRYYKKMLEEGLLNQKKYDMLVDYWKKMECKKCPMCGKDTLEWNIID